MPLAAMVVLWNSLTESHVNNCINKQISKNGLGAISGYNGMNGQLELNGNVMESFYKQNGHAVLNGSVQKDGKYGKKQL